MDTLEVKAIARNSMMDKLRNKLQAKNIEVAPVEMSYDDDMFGTEPDSPNIYKILADSQRAERVEVEKLYSIAQIGNDLVGGEAKTVAMQIKDAKSKNVDSNVLLLTSDEDEARAFLENAEETEKKVTTMASGNELDEAQAKTLKEIYKMVGTLGDEAKEHLVTNLYKIAEVLDDEPERFEEIDAKYTKFVG